MADRVEVRFNMDDPDPLAHGRAERLAATCCAGLGDSTVKILGLELEAAALLEEEPAPVELIGVAITLADILVLNLATEAARELDREEVTPDDLPGIRARTRQLLAAAIAQHRDWVAEGVQPAGDDPEP
jgi:hypothetical protein